MPLEFTRPTLLLWLLAVAPVFYALYRRSLSDFPRRQRALSLAMRLVIASLIIAAAAGLTLLRQSERAYYLFLVDRSGSVDAAAAKFADDYIAAAAQGLRSERVGFVPFAKAVEPLQASWPPGDKPDRTDPTDPTDPSDSTPAVPPNTPSPPVPPDAPAEIAESAKGTDIAAAIHAAAAYMPTGYVPRLVLLSDGNQTAGDAASAAAAVGIPVDAVPLPSRSEPEVQIAAVDVPAEVREGEPFFVDVTVQSNHEDRGRIEIYRGDFKVVDEERPLKAGENRFRFQQSIERDRLAAYAVRISGCERDTLLDNNAEIGLVYASGKPRVLVIESDPDLIRDLAYALEQEGVAVDVRPPQGMPDSLSDLQNYECLIMSNVPATSLRGAQMEMVRTYVQQLGGGLIMLGGEQSFGLGGYYKTALEEILPVRSDFEKEKETPSLGMVLVIDKSGSMGGDKIEMAKTAAREAAELLGSRDKLAVLAFDGDTYVISEMQSASNKAQIEGDIATIEASGGTSMGPGMEQALEILTATQAKLKHVILLTDGVSEPGDFHGLAQQMAAAKITLTAVAVGEGADTALLEELARIGKGRYYFAGEADQVPQIFAKETVTASKSAIDEQPFIPIVVRATHALADIDMEASPFLLGYVMTRPKPTSEVILATERGDPLLAWWRYGLGMTAAFTSDAKSRWAAEWLTWEGFGKFWTQVVRQTMRKSDASGVSVAARRTGEATELQVDAVDQLGRFLNGAEVELTAIDPRMKRTSVPLRQSAPGRYAATLPTPLSGAYHLELAVKKDGEVLYRQSRGVSVGYSDELRIRPTDETLLRRIAEASGGRYSPAAEGLLAADSRTAARPVPLWPYLLAAAACLLVLDIALRRVDLSLPPFSIKAIGA